MMLTGKNIRETIAFRSCVQVHERALASSTTGANRIWDSCRLAAAIVIARVRRHDVLIATDRRGERGPQRNPPSPHALRQTQRRAQDDQRYVGQAHPARPDTAMTATNAREGTRPGALTMRISTPTSWRSDRS